MAPGDDTELGRPPRHARATVASEDRDLEPFGRDHGTPAVSGSVTCAGDGCRRKVKIDLEAGRPPFLVSIAQRQLSGSVPILCQSCDDETEEAEAARLEVEEAAERRRVWLDGSGIPSRWRPWTFDRLDHDADRLEAITAAMEWGSGKRKRGLLLWGEVGRGKTLIAAAAAMARLDVQPVRWLGVAQTLKDLRMPFGSPEYARAQRSLDAMGGARRALVLDDLDKLPAVSDHALSPLFVAIDGWVSEDLPLLVTSNRDLDGIEEDFGDRFGKPIASRLMGHCKVVEVRGRDRRQG